MLYLVLPNGTLQWTDLLGQSLIDSARAEGTDLGDIDWWKDADRIATADDLRVALRYGLASRVGIVVDAGNVVQVRRPVEMRTQFAQTAQNRVELEPQLAQLDRVFGAGAAEHRKELDERVNESLANAVREAEEDAAATLAVSVDESLVAHWVSLRGLVPDPL